MLHINTILVPTDFSEGSLHAVRYAVAFAQKFHAKLHLVHVLEIPPGLTPDALVHPDLEGKMITLQNYLEKLSQEKFVRIQQYIENKGVKSTTVLAHGAPHESIVKTAEAEKADMIIMGTHGRTGLQHFFMGSTAERVVRYAQCPVTVIRIHEDDELAAEHLTLLSSKTA